MLYNNEIDLHGYDVISAKIATNEFVIDQVAMKNEIVVIIHGVGKGLVRKAVHEVLKTNKLVVSYKLDNFNSGCTIVKLNIDK